MINMKIYIETKGFEEVLERFKRMERATKKEIGKEALDKAGEMLIQALQEEAPKDTGKLSASMQVISRGVTRITVGAVGGEDRNYFKSFYNHYGNSFTNGLFFYSVAYYSVRDEIYQMIKETLIEAILGK